DRLLVGRGPRVEDVLRELLAFVLHGIVEEPVQLFEDRQHRLAGDGGPAAEDGRHLVLRNELARLLREERPVRGGIDHHRLDLHAEDAALGVDLLEGHERDFLERRLADGHRSGERVEDTDLDGAGGPGLRREEEETCENRERATPADRHYCLPKPAPRGADTYRQRCLATKYGSYKSVDAPRAKAAPAAFAFPPIAKGLRPP